MGRPADRPNVFRKPTGILESQFYQASLRIPQPNLHGASGRNTPENIRIMTASAGSIEMVKNSQGVMQYFVKMIARPVDQ